MLTVERKVRDSYDAFEAAQCTFHQHWNATMASNSTKIGLTFFLALLTLPLTLKAQDSKVPDELATVAEKSKYTKTSTSAQVEAFVEACAKKAKHVTRYDFGKTVGGKKMVSAIVASPAYEIGKSDKRAVVFLLGNIHSGECAGKEGLLKLLRELTLNDKHPLLKNLVIIFAPNYNADGNDKFKKTNRPGQKGPSAGMGVRPNNMGLDLNREFIKLESPEARSLIAYFNKANPEIFIDCHTTNGSVHQYGLTYDVPHNPASPALVRKFLRSKMMPAVTSQLEKNHGYFSFYYGNFNRGKTVWRTYGYEPRYSTEYFGLRGGLGILSEAYSYISYKDRIKVSYGFVLECLRFANDNTADIKEVVASARNEFVKVASKKPSDIKFPLAAKMTAFDKKFTIKGYDGDDRQDYEVDFWGKYEPTANRQLAWAYVIPAKYKKIVDHLLRHGIQVAKLDEKTDDLHLENYIIRNFEKSRHAFQKHRMVKETEGELKDIHQSIEAGSFIVKSGQPLGRLVATMLEPESSDGLVTWNFFDDDLEKDKAFPVLRIPGPVELKTSPVKSKTK